MKKKATTEREKVDVEGLRKFFEKYSAKINELEAGLDGKEGPDEMAMASNMMSSVVRFHEELDNFDEGTYHGGDTVQCTFWADDFVDEVYYNGANVRSKCTGNINGCCQEKHLTFTGAKGAVLAIAANDNQPGTSAGFKFRCSSDDPASPWNFTLTPKSGADKCKAFGVAGPDQHHGAMKRPSNKDPPRGWTENVFNDSDWGAPGKATGGNAHGHDKVWYDRAKYTFYRIMPLQKMLKETKFSEVKITYKGVWKDKGQRAIPGGNHWVSRPGQMKADIESFIERIKRSGETKGYYAVQFGGQVFSSIGDAPHYKKHGFVGKRSSGSRSNNNYGLRIPGRGKINVIGGPWQNAVYCIRLMPLAANEKPINIPEEFKERIESLRARMVAVGNICFTKMFQKWSAQLQGIEERVEDTCGKLKSNDQINAPLNLDMAGLQRKHYKIRSEGNAPENKKLPAGALPSLNVDQVRTLFKGFANEIDGLSSEFNKHVFYLMDQSADLASKRFVSRINQIRERAKSLDFSFSKSAYIENIHGISDKDAQKHWTIPHTPLPEYQAAADMICVEKEWMSDTILLRQIRDATSLFGEDLKDMKSDAAFDNECLKAIQKAYKLGSREKAKKQKDILSGQVVFHKCKQVYNTLEAWKKPYMAHAMKIMAEMDNDTAAITAKLTEVVDRSLHCRQVQVKSFNLVMSHSYRLILSLKYQLGAKNQAKQVSVGLDDYGGALLRIFEIVEDYLDDHKENAFKSSFMEPNRFYFEFRNHREGWTADNVDTHAINYYLTFINAALGVHLPLLPAYWENWPETVVDFWKGLNDKCWAEFSDPSHFGMSWQGIASLKRGGKKFVNDGGIPRAQFPKGSRPPPAKEFANNNVNPRGNAAHRAALAIYLERFAAFFRRDFFVTKCFNKLNSEEKPEHAGFRKSCQTLYNVFRTEQGIDSRKESYLEYFYDDDMYMEFNVKHAAKFFVWLGIVKPDDEVYTMNPDKVENKNKDAAAQETKAAPEIAALETQTQFEVEIQALNKKIGDAIQSRNTSAIRSLITERNALQKRQKESKKQEKSPGPMLKRSESELEAEERLVEIAGELQEAMRSRDTSSIRLLMAERSALNAKYKDRQNPIPEEDGAAEIKSAPQQPSKPPSKMLERHDSYNDTEEFKLDQETVEFIDQLTDTFSEAKNRSADFRAAVVERWQVFEMCHASSPGTICRVGKLIATDERFQHALFDAVANKKSDCLRDSSGIIFRLYGMLKDGEMKGVDKDTETILVDAYETIMAGVESRHVERISGHSIGSLYMQAASAWTSAHNNATSTVTLKKAVQRLGNSIVEWHDKKGQSNEAKKHVKGRLIKMYTDVMEGPVWGGPEGDVMMRRFG